LFYVYNCKYNTDKMKESVGIIIIARDTNNFLMLHRVTNPIVWSILTGKMDKIDESAIDTVKREIKEEINLDPNLVSGIRHLGSIRGNKKFNVFVGFVETELKLNLKLDENDDYGWYNENKLPSPLHKKWGETFQLVKPLLSLRENFIKHVKLV
jgi:8-oxo-dGTP pyrophosphatase MutT (NUDIX family)